MQLIENIKTLTVQTLHHIQKSKCVPCGYRSRWVYTQMEIPADASSLTHFTFMSLHNPHPPSVQASKGLQDTPAPLATETPVRAEGSRALQHLSSGDTKTQLVYTTNQELARDSKPGVGGKLGL